LTQSNNMTSLFPHPVYAEDQQNAHAILYLHVVRASAMSFTFFSLFRIPLSIIGNNLRKIPINMSALWAKTLRSSGRALIVGSGVGALATWGRMQGREEIEWQDRSWRVLENKGELITDWVTIGGAGTAAVGAALAARRGMIPMSVGGALLGGAGAGSSVGVPFMLASFARGRKPA
jgi:hypothetical protein